MAETTIIVGNHCPWYKMAAGTEKSFVFIDKYCIRLIADSFTILSAIAVALPTPFPRRSFSFLSSGRRTRTKRTQKCANVTRSKRKQYHLVFSPHPTPSRRSRPSRVCHADDDIIIIPHAPRDSLLNTGASRPHPLYYVRTQHDRMRSLHNRNVTYAGVI